MCEEATGSRIRDKTPPAGVVDTDGIIQKSHSKFVGVRVPGKGPDGAASPGGEQGRLRPPRAPWAGKDPAQSPQRNKTSFLLLNGTVYFEKFPVSGNYSEGSAEGLVITVWG